jgi:hypothetical protein
MKSCNFNPASASAGACSRAHTSLGDAQIGPSRVNGRDLLACAQPILKANERRDHHEGRGAPGAAGFHMRPEGFGLLLEIYGFMIHSVLSQERVYTIVHRLLRPPIQVAPKRS